MSGEDYNTADRIDGDGQKPEKMFTLKKWNAVAMWSWDVQCDTCAICRIQVMGKSCCNKIYVRPKSTPGPPLQATKLEPMSWFGSDVRHISLPYKNCQRALLN